MSSINSASNHQPVLIGVAQHGSLDDAVYFTVSDDPSSEPGTDGSSSNGGTGTGVGEEQPIGAGEEAPQVTDTALAPASTTVDIGEAQTSLLESLESSIAAEETGAEVEVPVESQAPQPQPQVTATTFSTSTRRRFTRTFTRTRFGGGRNNFARAE